MTDSLPLNRPFQFAVLGNAVVDAIAHVDDALLRKFNLRKGDSNTLSHQEMLDISASVEVENFRSGGSGGNTAYTLSRLGERVCFLGLIGGDPAGRHFAEDMVAAGVTVTPVKKGQRTLEVFTLITPDGERTMVQSAPSMPSSDDAWVDENLIEQSSCLLLEAYACGSYPAACEYAARIAHAAGCKLVILLSAPRAVHVAAETLLELISVYQPLVIGNQAEWNILLEAADARVERRLESTTRVLTRRGEGATYYGEGGKVVDYPTQSVPRLVDATGAGDAFAAGFLHVYTSGGSPNLALAQGHRLGLAVVLSLGPRLSNPTDAL